MGRGRVEQTRRRAGRHARRRVRHEIWQSARQNTSLILTFLAGYAIVSMGAVAAFMTWGRGDHAWFMAGLLIGALPFFFQTFVVASGFSQRQLGAEAERWTAEELERLDARDWAVFHDIPLGQVNVDHVAIGPGRVYAIETKWTSSIEVPDVRSRLARQAAHRASVLQRRLADHGVDRRVVPLLVTWGPGVRDALTDRPQLVDGVRVVAGRASDTWLDRMRDAADQFTIDHPAREAVARLIRGQRDESSGGTATR